MTEPQVIHATVRESEDADGEKCWDIECRFNDGQKWAPIHVAFDMPQLADRIAKLLSE